MSRYVNRLIERQAATGQVVTPRLRSKFEPEAIPSQVLAMESVAKTDTGPESASAGVRASVPSLSETADTKPSDQRAKDETGREMQVQARASRSSGKSADIPEQPGGKQTDRPGPPQERLSGAPLPKAEKPDAVIAKPALEAVSGDRAVSQNRQEEQETREKPEEKREASAEDGILRKRITAYETAPEKPIRRDTPAREEGLQGRGALGEAASAGRKSADQSVGRMTPEPAPVIRVSIGRIEVHAIHPPPAQPMKTQAAVKPKMTLEDFLKKRNEL